MAVTKAEAKKIVLDNLEDGTEIKGSHETDDRFLFLAVRPDPLEGRLDPFFSVNKKTGEFRDFSPQDFDNPVVILRMLNAYG